MSGREIDQLAGIILLICVMAWLIIRETRRLPNSRSGAPRPWNQPMPPCQECGRTEGLRKHWDDHRLPHRWICERCYGQWKDQQSGARPRLEIAVKPSRIEFPSVCCVMLTRDRPEMARQAVESFRRQTYADKHLLIYNTSNSGKLDIGNDGRVSEVLAGERRGATIGALRNLANGYAGQAMILIHWDDDDLSHCERIADQVALLQASGADIVGYRECLFWREPEEAWIYANNNPRYAIGSSLCYWRQFWDKHPFQDLPAARGGTGEDHVFLRETNSIGVSGLGVEPRLICRIHSANTADYAAVVGKSTSWTRAPQWDDYCRNWMTAFQGVRR